jgi:hypothetical protein
MYRYAYKSIGGEIFKLVLLTPTHHFVVSPPSFWTTSTYLPLLGLRCPLITIGGLQLHEFLYFVEAIFLEELQQQ